MAYYMGDYYGGRIRGDYYRGKGQGDPFWGALWSGIRAVGGAILGVSRPAVGQAGAAAASQGVSGVVGAAAARTAAGAIPAAARATLPGTAISVAQRAIAPVGRVLRSPMGRNIAAGIAAGTIIEIGGRFFDAQTGRQLGRRRMNPANPRALRRSIRRVVGFARLASRSKRSVAKAATALQCFPRRGARAAARRR